MAYIGKSPTGTGVRSRFYYTQTSGGGTSISGTDDNSKTLTFTDGEYIDVFLNGVLLVAGTDYNTSTANTIAGLAALANGDVIEVVVYDIFTVADTVSSLNGGTFSNNVTINGDLTVDTNALFVDASANEVGIGTTTPATYTDYVSGSNAPSVVVAGSQPSYVLADTDISGNDGTLGITKAGEDTVINNLGAGNVRISNNGAERMRIDSSGIVSIGNTIGSSFNSGANNLVVGTGSGSEGITIYGGNESNIFFADGTDIADNLRGRIEYSHLSEGMLFYVNNTYAGRIDSDTSLLLGTSSKGGSEKLSLIGAPAFNMAHASTGTVGVFRTSGISGSIVGSISVSGSATAYNTSSDYRLKQNVQDMTGAIDRVKQLAPKRFNFIADADTTVDGFLAHEAQAIVPEAISGTKDETREVNNAVLSSDGRLLGEDITQAKWTAGKQATEKDGETIPAIYPSDSTWSAKHTEPVMQGIDQSKLVPLLTAALKESIAKIETLETKVAALENAE